MKRIRELLNEKEYPITGDSPLARYALELRNEIRPLLNRVERLEVDARRYQWLRGRNCIDWDAFTFADGYEHPDSALDSYELMLDAAIDASLRGKGE